MKASEYFEKYKDKINTDEGCVEILSEMSNEVQIIAKERNTRSNSSVISIIKEINQKWNAVVKLVEEEYGYELLKRNGFIIYWRTKIPGL